MTLPLLKIGGVTKSSFLAFAWKAGDNLILVKEVQCQSCIVLSSLLCAGAEPSDSEKDVHSKVADILVKAPDILTSLRNYKGAGELIREVSGVSWKNLA